MHWRYLYHSCKKNKHAWHQIPRFKQLSLLPCQDILDHGRNSLDTRHLCLNEEQVSVPLHNYGCPFSRCSAHCSRIDYWLLSLRVLCEGDRSHELELWHCVKHRSNKLFLWRPLLLLPLAVPNPWNPWVQGVLSQVCQGDSWCRTRVRTPLLSLHNHSIHVYNWNSDIEDRLHLRSKRQHLLQCAGLHHPTRSVLRGLQVEHQSPRCRLWCADDCIGSRQCLLWNHSHHPRASVVKNYTVKIIYNISIYSGW